MEEEKSAIDDIWLVSFSEHDDRELTLPEIAHALHDGLLNADHLVWREGWGKWQRIGDTPTLTNALRRRRVNFGLPRAPTESVDWTTSGSLSAAAALRIRRGSSITSTIIGLGGGQQPPVVGTDTAFSDPVSPETVGEAGRTSELLVAKPPEPPPLPEAPEEIASVGVAVRESEPLVSLPPLAEVVVEQVLVEQGVVDHNGQAETESPPPTAASAAPVAAASIPRVTGSRPRTERSADARDTGDRGASAKVMWLLSAAALAGTVVWLVSENGGLLIKRVRREPAAVVASRVPSPATVLDPVPAPVPEQAAAEVVGETIAPVPSPTAQRTSEASKAGGERDVSRSLRALRPEAPPTRPEPAVTASLEEPNKEFDAQLAITALSDAALAAGSCRKPGDPSGVAKVIVTFNPTGKATRVVVEGPPFAGTETGGCIAATMRKARVPEFAGERVSVAKKVVIR